MNFSSVSVRWDSAFGEFDFHRVNVTNTSVTNTLTIPKEERVAMVTGLLDGCSYNVSVERVRGVTAGSPAFLTVTTGRRYNKGCTGQHYYLLLLLPALITSSLNYWNFPHLSDSFPLCLVLHECQPLYEECASWMCLHVHLRYFGRRQWGVWTITRWTCNQTREKSQCTLHVMDTFRYTHIHNETHTA